MDVRGLIGPIDVLIGLLVSALAWPLVKGRVEMDHFYGMRARRAFGSEERWHKVMPAVQSLLNARRAWAGLSRPLADDRGGAGH